MPLLFKNAVSAKDLQEGAEFNIDDEFESSSEEEYFEDESSNAFKEEMNKLKASGELEVDFSCLSLEELKDKMSPLSEDGLVKKIIIKPGTSIEIPAKSIVSMHYNAYIEGSDEPFDSTYTRNKPHRFLFNAQRLVRGLDLGVATMTVGELSKFWIHSSYAYGPMGCPPRIPANANVIYEVEVLNFIDSSAAVEFEEMTPEDQRNAAFEKVYGVCKVEHQTGNDLVSNKKYTAAISRYQKARKLLENVNVENGEEDQKRLHFLKKLYINLAVTYYKVKKPTRVICHSRNALAIDGDDAKALFYMGRGFLLNNEFDKAGDYLQRAKKKCPYDPAINAELKNLETRRQKYNMVSKEFCQRMFRNNETSDQEVHNGSASESPEFIQTITERIQQFKNSSDEEYLFSSAYTPGQIEVIENIAKSQNCHFVEKIYQGQKVIKIKKI